MNINSIRNKFDFLAQGNTDALMVSETKLDESSPDQFLLDGYSAFSVVTRTVNDSGIWLYIRGDISKLLSMNKNIEGFFVEINSRKKKKWLLSC